MTEEELTPLTFKIYVYMLKRNPERVKITQISHDFHISPQLAFYHLKKLMDIGYVKHVQRKKDLKWNEWGYYITKIVPVGHLKSYLFLANRFLIPRQVIFIIVFFILLCLSWLSPYPRLIQAICIIPLILNLYDLYKQQQKL